MKRVLLLAQTFAIIIWAGGTNFAQQSSLVPASIATSDSSNSSNSAVQPVTSQKATARPGFFGSWEERVHKTMSEQTAWPIPLVTASSGLIECFRSDFARQITPAGTDTWNYGYSKGANLIPWYNTEFDAAVPPYIEHNSKAQDGFGDFAMSLKYRLAAGDANGRNYSVSASLGSTLPTGSYSNGALDATIIPTVYAGKGFGPFDVQSSLGATLPVADTAKLGRVIAWNTVGQYRVARFFWPEIEDNAFFYHAGPNDGRIQNFVTPGLIFSKIRFKRDWQSHSALVFGGGMQIATSHFHTYNHGLVLTVRTLF
jgi:hypothetical protein